MDVKVSPVYFIGIGGIGMSALARYFKSIGAEVSGYDKTATGLTKELEAEGIKVHYEENTDLVPKNVALVVYTPAIPGKHKELVFYREHGYKVVKRSDVLQWITAGSFNICVAGTHGKTTISTMMAHVLRHSGYGCNAFLGGISVNYGTNFWGSDNNVCVVEADEYDRSFLKLTPDVAVISAMDADHLDVYGTAAEMEKAFLDFSRKLKPGGLLVSKYGLKREKDFTAANHITYSLADDKAAVYAENIRMKEGSYYFDAVVSGRKIENITLHMGGMHNVENALVAIAVAGSLKISDEKIRDAVQAFRGVKRRFEYIIKTSRITFVDDYAHHPEELRALIQGAKSLFADKKCTVVFQPHLYSRTRDLADGFAEALDLADEIVLLPVYPARELPVVGVSSKMIADRMKNKNKWLVEKEELETWIKSNRTGNKDWLLITAGAGDIDKLVEPVKKIIEEGLTK